MGRCGLFFFFSSNKLKHRAFQSPVRFVFKHTSAFFDGIRTLSSRRATLLMGFCVFLSKFFPFRLLDANTFYRKHFIHCIRKRVVTILQLVEKNWAWFGFFYCKSQFLICAFSMHLQCIFWKWNHQSDHKGWHAHSLFIENLVKNRLQKNIWFKRFWKALSVSHFSEIFLLLNNQKNLVQNSHSFFIFFYYFK